LELPDLGETWCERCRCFHKNLPPGYDVIEEMSIKLAAEIAEEIDNEILAELMKAAKKK
jgi:hypothetical protein